MRILRRNITALCLFGLPAIAGGATQGINNFHEVNEHVYRGAQPTADGFKYLATMGIKTIVDLRASGERSSLEKQVVTSFGMKYVNVPMTGLTAPTQAEITKILALLEDGKSGPVFVHCLRGADRTGAVIAAYRIDHDHWDNSQALREAMSLGMHFYELPRQMFILRFRPLTTKEVPKSSSAVRPTGQAPVFLALTV